jgi:hypothetical protein
VTSPHLLLLSVTLATVALLSRRDVLLSVVGLLLSLLGSLLLGLSLSLKSGLLLLSSLVSHRLLGLVVGLLLGGLLLSMLLLLLGGLLLEAQELALELLLRRGQGGDHGGKLGDDGAELVHLVVIGETLSLDAVELSAVLALELLGNTLAGRPGHGSE